MNRGVVKIGPWRVIYGGVPEGSIPGPPPIVRELSPRGAAHSLQVVYCTGPQGQRVSI